MKGCYCVNGYLFYWLRPAILFIQIYIVEVLTVQHWDTVTMLQVHQERCVVGPHYNQCHQRSVAVIVSIRVLTSSNLAEPSSCAGWHGTTYTHQPWRTGWNSVGQLTYACIQPSRCFMARCYRFSYYDGIIREEQVFLLYQRFLLHTLVLGFLTTRK